VAKTQEAGRPRPRRVHGGRNRRAQILQAAAAVFVRDGFARASLDTIAAEANVAKQTLYNHFGDRDSLVAEVVAAAMDPLAGQFDTLVRETIAAHDGTDLPAQFLDFGRRWVRLMLGDTAALRWRILTEAQVEEPLRKALRGLDRDAGLRAVAEQLALLARAGHLNIVDTEAAARQLRALLVGEAQLESMLGQVPLREVEIDAVVKRGIDMFMKAYGPR
jgi:AcrR family transcriptional regulator